MEDEMTNLVPEGSEVEDVSNEVDPTEIEDGDNPDGEPQPEIEEIEVERAGVKYKIPKALEAELMLQSDYTRKTQEVAETRKALESRIETFEQAGEQELNAKARMVSIDAALTQYEQIDWTTWSNQDPQSAQTAFMQFQMLKDGRVGAEQEYNQAKEARELETQQVTAKQIEQGLAQLEREIPGFGPATFNEIATFSETTYGLTRQDVLEAAANPAAIKILLDAQKWRAAESKTKVAQKVQAQQSVQPAAKVSGGNAPKRPLDDRTSIDTWMKARNERQNRK